MKHFKRPGLKKKLGCLVVRRRATTPAGVHLGRVQAGGVVIPAALGVNGIRFSKREGDGMTPAGTFELDQGFFRQDRFPAAEARHLRPLSPRQGWCDDPRSQQYNRPVPAGFKKSHERLWRDDNVYDVVIPTSHNQRPRILGRGSAIFLHLARPGFAGTQGCIAISRDDMRRLLPRLAKKVRLIIKP